MNVWFPASGMFGFFGLMWFVLPILVALVIVWAIRSQPHYMAPPPPGMVPPRDTPLDILARRFAAGEITAEEYQKARDLLQGGNPPAG